MRALFLTLSLLAVSNSAHALRNTAKWKDNCEGGIARACYEYGVWLQTQAGQKFRDEGARYVRRACSMAYAPACNAKAPAVVRAVQTPVIKEGYVQKDLPTQPVEGNSPVAQPKLQPGGHMDPSLDDMKDIQQLENYHAQMKKTANGILAKGKGAGFKVDDGGEYQAPASEGPPAMSVWERAGFRPTPWMIWLVGAKNFRVTAAAETAN